MGFSSTKKKIRTLRSESPNKKFRAKDLPKDTRERLIKVAKTLFAEHGIDGTTVKQISDVAGLNISLISYHFKGKEGLYRTCIEKLGKARLAMTERVLQEPQSVEEFKVRLSLFIDDFFNAHLEEPELSKIVARECEMNMPLTQDIFKNTFFKMFETIVHFFKSAQNKDLIRKDLDVEVMSGLFFGGLVHIAQRDRINEVFFELTIRDRKYREIVIQQALLFCLQGCLISQSNVTTSLG
jgi:AcrR family transcriptional regulator